MKNATEEPLFYQNTHYLNRFLHNRVTRSIFLQHPHDPEDVEHEFESPLDDNKREKAP